MGDVVRVLVYVIVFLLTGCSTAGTTLILMPDESGKVGAITVKTKSEFKVIDTRYGTVTLKDGDARLSSTEPLSEAQVYADYARLLKSQPSKPLSFILYFISGTADLVKTSQARVALIVDRINAQMPTEITLIGHTDTTGSDDFNDLLSLKRAKAVEKLLKENIPALHEINVQYFGAKNLLVPTPPNVEEQRNRGVEILVL